MTPSSEPRAATTEASPDVTHADLVSWVTPDSLPSPPSRPRRLRDLLVLDFASGTPCAFLLGREAQENPDAAVFDIPHFPTGDQVDHPEFFRELHDILIRQGADTKRVAVVLPEPMVQHVSVTTPRLGPNALRRVFRQKIHSTAGFEDAEMVLGYRSKQRQGDRQMESLVVAARRRELLGVCHGLRGIDLEPIAFFPSIATVQRLHQHLTSTEQDTGATAIIEIGDHVARFNLIHDSAIYYDRRIKIDAHESSHFRSILVRQVHRALLHHQQQRPDHPLSRVYLLDSDRERAEEISRDFAREFLVPISVLDPTTLSAGDDYSHSAITASIAGSLILLGGEDAKSFNLVPKEFRARRRNMALTSLTILAAIMGIGGGFQGRAMLQDANTARLALLDGYQSDIRELRKHEKDSQVAASLRGEISDQLEALEELNPRKIDVNHIISFLGNTLDDKTSLTSIELKARSKDSAPRLILEGHYQGKYLEAQQAVAGLARKLRVGGLVQDVESGPLQPDGQPGEFSFVNFSLECRLEPTH